MADSNGAGAADAHEGEVAAEQMRHMPDSSGGGQMPDNEQNNDLSCLVLPTGKVLFCLIISVLSATAPEQNCVVLRNVNLAASGNLRRHVKWRQYQGCRKSADGAIEPVPPPECTVSGGYRSGAAGSSPMKGSPRARLLPMMSPVLSPEMSAPPTPKMKSITRYARTTSLSPEMSG